MGTHRAPRGSVSVQQRKYGRRLKYRYQGKEYFLTLHAHMAISIERLCAVIQHDLATCTHDNSQEKYKRLMHSEHVPRLAAPPSSSPSTLQLFEQFLSATGRGLDKHIYFYTHTMLKNWGKIRLEEIPSYLASMRYSTSTLKDRRTVLNQFFKWLIRRGKVRENPLEELPASRKTAKSSTRRRLSDNEVRKVLEAIRLDTYNPSSSRYRHSHYYPIFLFLAQTGCRPAEAIGLQVEKVNWKRKTVLIDQALARGWKGTHAKARRMKNTKMEDSREVSLNRELLRMLRGQCAGKQPSDLVFVSPTGRSCDDRKMGENVLRPVLEGLGIEKRVLYCFRHSFISRCFQQGMDIKSVQALTGHRDVEVLLRIYAEVTVTKVELPRL